MSKVMDDYARGWSDGYNAGYIDAVYGDDAEEWDEEED